MGRSRADAQPRHRVRIGGACRPERGNSARIARARRRGRADIAAAAPARRGERVLHRHHDHRAGRSGNDRGRDRPEQTARPRLRIRRIWPPSRRLCHRRLCGSVHARSYPPRRRRRRRPAGGARFSHARRRRARRRARRLRLGARCPRRHARDGALPPRAGPPHGRRDDQGGASKMPRLSADRRHRVRFVLNGRPVEAEAEPRMLLTDFLRHTLGMTGTHVGCEHGVCGACTIEIDGVPARACLTLAVQADGTTIRTVEASRARAGQARRAAGRLPASSCAAMRLLHRRHSDVARYLSARPCRSFGGRAARISRRASVPLHRLRADRGGGIGRRGQAAGGRAPCLISATAFLPASNAIRTRSRSSMGRCG